MMVFFDKNFKVFETNYYLPTWFISMQHLITIFYWLVDSKFRDEVISNIRNIK